MTGTKYVIDRGKEETFELPEGWSFTSIPRAVKGAAGEEMYLYSVEVFNQDGNNEAVFSNVTAFYPATMEPTRKTWVEK